MVENIMLTPNQWCERLKKAIESKSGVIDVLSVLGRADTSDTWVRYALHAEKYFNLKKDKYTGFERITRYILRQSPPQEIQSVRKEMLRQTLQKNGKWFIRIVGGSDTENGFNQQRYERYMFDGSDQFNTFPGGVQTDLFHEFLVVELDDPKFNLNDLNNIVKSRIRRHISGDRTFGIELRTDGDMNVVRKLIHRNLNPLFKKWRFADDTFAKEIRIIYREDYGMDEKTY